MQEAVSTILFDEPGPQNTQTTIDAALLRASQLAIPVLVVASDTGKTARAVLERLPSGMRLVVVSNPAGMMLPVAKLHNYLPRFREHRQTLESKGIKTTPASLTLEQARALQDAGATVLRVDWRKLGAYTRNDLRALECIGVAVRVALTISITAMLASELHPNQDAIALAGTGFGGGGADTALLVRPAALWRDWRILELLARPRFGPPGE